MTSDWADEVHDIILHKWPYSSQHGRDNVISVVERLMNGEVIEFIGVEIKEVTEAQDEIDFAVSMGENGNNEHAVVQLLAVIARAMVDKKTPNIRKKEYVTGE